MKKAPPLSFIIIALLLLSSVRLCAQKDKVIIQSAQAMLTHKACDSAFYQVLTVKKVKNGKVQDIIKKAYPCLISKNVKKVNALAIVPKDDDKTQIEKLNKMIVLMKMNNVADSLLNLSVKPDVYKQLSRRKATDKSLMSYEKQIKAANEDMIKQARIKKVQDSLVFIESIRQAQIADSIKNAPYADSIRMAKEAAIARQNDSIAAIYEKKGRNAKTIPVKKEKIVVPETTDSGPKKYYIIAGAYETEEAAQEAVNKLKAKGFKSEIVNRNQDGNLRICYNSYSSHSAAMKDLDLIRSKYRHDAWILAK